MKKTIEGVDTNITERGSGPPLLLLHGNPDSSASWKEVIDRLQDKYRCIAPDLPGFGDSHAPPDLDLSLKGMAKWVNGVVDAAGVKEPLALAVHDFGGPYGLSWAVEHPERVRALFITNTLYASEYRWHFWARVWRTPILGEFSMAIANWPLFKREMKRGARKLSEEHVRAMWALFTPAMKKMVLRLYRATDPENFKGWEDRLLALTAKVPTRVVWGEHDPFIPLKWAQEFGTKDVEIVPTSGHWVYAEEPELVADRIRSFVG